MYATIDVKKIKPNTNFIARNIEYFKTVKSTNTVAKENEYTDGTLIIAEEQTTGRGRMGREWVSESKTGIYMSIVLTPKISAEKISLLTLIAGISICEALEEVCNTSFKIKWPNDIVADGKKICGILTEGVISKNSIKAIVGIGINVNNISFGNNLTDKATSLHILTGKNFSKEIIINKIAEKFEKKHQEFLSGKTFKDEYERFCININREVVAIKNSVEIKATAIGITDIGELIIKKEDGTTLNINSGEVSVRGIYGYY